MLKLTITHDECKYIMMDINKLNRQNPGNDNVLKKILPQYIKNDLLQNLEEDRISLTVTYKSSELIIILNRKDAWNKFTITERFNGNVYNRFDVLYKNDRFYIEEVNPDFRQRCHGPFQNMKLILNHISGEYTPKNESMFHVSQKQLEEDWRCSSTVTLSYILSVLQYVAEYQGRELEKQLGKPSSQSKEIAVNINKYKYANDEKEKKKKEEIKLIKKRNKKEKDMISEEKPTAKHTSETSKTSDKEYEKVVSELNKYKCLLEEEKKKNEELKNIKKEYERDHYELLNLREALKKQTVDRVDDIDLPPFDEMAEKIKDIKLLIIGGHTNWHNRLSDIFKNMSAIGSSEYKSDMNKIYKADYIYFFTNHISHGIYNKALDLMREHNVMYGYINNTNLEQNIAQIYQDYIEKEETDAETR